MRAGVTQGPCFVCAFIAGHPGYWHNTIFEDDDWIAFLARYPTLLGYTLVAPKSHVEDWVHELSEAQFLRFQSFVRAVAAGRLSANRTDELDEFG